MSLEVSDDALQAKKKTRKDKIMKQKPQEIKVRTRPRRQGMMTLMMHQEIKEASYVLCTSQFLLFIYHFFIMLSLYMVGTHLSFGF